MSLEREIQRIREMYDRFQDLGLYKSKWAPFDEKEALHRTTQYIQLAYWMRWIGRLDLSGLKILDVGCGKGRVLRSFLDMGASHQNLFGVDLRAHDIEEAKRISPTLHFSVTDGMSVNFSDNSFDLITQFVVFSSIANPELRLKLASEMWRVLKPGGYIFWWDLRDSIGFSGYKSELLNMKILFLKTSIAQNEINLLEGKSKISLRAFFQSLKFKKKPPTHISALIGPKTI